MLTPVGLKVVAQAAAVTLTQALVMRPPAAAVLPRAVAASVAVTWAVSAVGIGTGSVEGAFALMQRMRLQAPWLLSL